MHGDANWGQLCCLFEGAGRRLKGRGDHWEDGRRSRAHKDTRETSDLNALIGNVPLNEVLLTTPNTSLPNVLIMLEKMKTRMAIQRWD